MQPAGQTEFFLKTRFLPKILLAANREEATNPAGAFNDSLKIQCQPRVPFPKTNKYKWGRLPEGSNSHFGTKTLM